MMSLTVNTDQEAFDAVVTRLFDGTGRAIQTQPDGWIACRYRTDDGNTCAVGCLIEPSSYRDWFEGVGVEELVSTHSLELGQVDMELLVQFQLFHDQTGGWDQKHLSVSGVSLLSQIAADFELDDSIIERLRGW